MEIIRRGSKTVDDILDGAEETTRPDGKAKNYEKSGGYEKALEDVESLNPVELKDISTSYGNIHRCEHNEC